MEFLREISHLPSNVSAYGWVPFVIAVLVSLFISNIFVRYYWDSSVRHQCSALASILGLSIALLASFLLPVDVFLVSFMKNPDGTFKEWATNATREHVEKSLTYSYYSIYGLILLFAFFVLPFVYFAYEEKDDDRRNDFGALFRAFIYTLVFLLIVTALLLAGAFIPFRTMTNDMSNLTNWNQIKFLLNELTDNRGENALLLVVNVLTMYGMLNLILYTGIGMASFPITMIKGFRSLSEEEMNIMQNQALTQSKINALRSKQARKSLSSGEISALADLEEEETLISRRASLLESEKKSISNKIKPLIRFFNVIFGTLGVLFALLLWISLLLSNVDKLMHSLGYNMGYILKLSQLPKPLDIIMVQAQKAFPLDYILFTAIIIFLVMCTISGIRYFGICCICVKMYKIRHHRTQPQGLLMLCFILMFIILGLNVLTYFVIPTYTTYGSQTYCKVNNETGNCTVTECHMDAPSDECLMTRAASFILNFAFKAWIFSASYFWLSWAFLLVFILSFFFVLLKSRQSAFEDIIDKDDFDDSYEEHPIRA